jgi:hypothetical protein
MFSVAAGRGMRRDSPNGTFQGVLPMTRRLRALYFLLLAAVAAGSLSAQSLGFVEPKWPQTFTLERGEHATYGFAVGVPGSISVRVEAKGAVVVSVVKPTGSIAKEQQGVGSFRLDYTATAADIALGVGWRLAVRAAAPPPMQGAPVPKAVAGSVAVGHPAGDPGKVKLLAAKPMTTAPNLFRPEVALAEIRAIRTKVVLDGRSKQLAALQHKVPPAAFQVISLRASALATTNPGTVAKSSVGKDPGALATKTPASKTTTVPVVPTIVSLDASSGSPGTQVLISGSGFGAAPGGEVHFIVAPGKDLHGSVTYWSDAQIVVGVPSITGVGPFAGQMYVRSGTTNSQLVPFRFEPELDYAILPITIDRQVSGMVGPNSIRHEGWPGIKGDDEFFLHTTLKNGWVLDEAYVIGPTNTPAHVPYIVDGHGEAYVSVATAGSSAPRIKVHWWAEVNGFYIVSLTYWPVVVIRGPKGLPWQ